MPTPHDVDAVIARALKRPAGELSDDLAFGMDPAWDSLAHVDLMLALEQAFGVTIGEDEMVELTSVAAIREFVASAAARQAP